MHFAAYALGLGTTGLTDDGVARYRGFGPRRWGVMFLTAVGVSGKALL